VETSELVEALKSRGRLLAGSADEGEKDMELVMMTLERLLTLASSAEPAGAGSPGSFKAKSSRW
jgi:hypothetical protein